MKRKPLKKSAVKKPAKEAGAKPPAKKAVVEKAPNVEEAHQAPQEEKLAPVGEGQTLPLAKEVSSEVQAGVGTQTQGVSPEIPTDVKGQTQAESQNTEKPEVTPQEVAEQTPVSNAPQAQSGQAEGTGEKTTPAIKESVPQEIVDENPPPGSSGTNFFVVGSIIMGILVLIGGVFLFLNLKSFVPSEKETITATPAPTAKKEEPTPALVRSDWTFEVLNGSGVSGAAKKAADLLEEKGYTVIETGNADKSTYETTQLFVAESLRDKASLLLDDLKGDLQVTTISGTLKESNSKVTAQIIIGKNQ